MKIRGKPFHTGDPRLAKGRRIGAIGQKTQAVRDLALAIVSDTAGLQKLQAKYRRGSLHPTVVQMLFAYAYGKPKDTIRLEGGLEALRIIIARDGDPLPLRPALAALPVSPEALAQAETLEALVSPHDDQDDDEQDA